jgi:hypothetical protein
MNLQLNNYCDQSLNEYENIVIIPRRGCHACVEQADRFFQENKSNKKYMFIFTRLMSEKRLRIELGNANLSLPNVVVDKENNFYIVYYSQHDYMERFRKEKNANPLTDKRPADICFARVKYNSKK